MAPRQSSTRATKSASSKSAAADPATEATSTVVPTTPAAAAAPTPVQRTRASAPTTRSINSGARPQRTNTAPASAHVNTVAQPTERPRAPLQSVNTNLPAVEQPRVRPRPISACNNGTAGATAPPAPTRAPPAPTRTPPAPNPASVARTQPSAPAPASVAVTLQPAPTPALPAPTPAPVAGSLNASQPAVTGLSPEEELEQLRARIRAQNEELLQLRSAGGAPPPPPPPGGSTSTVYDNDASIPRPRPLPTNLQAAMGLQRDRQLYLRCRRIVRNCANKVEEAHRLNWRDQPDEFIMKVKNLAKAKCPHLGRYRNGWATELLMSTTHKNKRRYKRVLERDPDGDLRKAQAIARKARRDSQEAEEDDCDGDDESSGSDDNGKGADVVADTREGTASAQMNAMDVDLDSGYVADEEFDCQGPSNGIDNTSDLSEDDMDDFYVDDAPSVPRTPGLDEAVSFGEGNEVEAGGEKLANVGAEEEEEEVPVPKKRKRQGGNRRK
ncbi:hypothetical protein CVT24_002085 [Panaeolus cyanescens]|uniref:Uncharacterized protein n=1 Tax=Panaeolus cyanescens TaxID=181874 RepID=A0A409YI65_9AGAR|nr:hypothetical protein CVT24_002085 [Panaeolus cyanescens]